jgi:hypothetical protein
VPEPAGGAHGLSGESRLYDASANSRVRRARVYLSNSLHQRPLIPSTRPVEWVHRKASFGWTRRL